MKCKILFAVALIFTTCFAAVSPKEAKMDVRLTCTGASATAKVDLVTVFSTQALVERTGEIAIPAGESQIEIQFLPQIIDPGSVRVTAESNVGVVIGGSEVFFEKWTPETFETLRDSIREIDYRLDELKLEEEGIATQSTFLQSVAALGGGAQNSERLIIAPENLSTTATFLQGQLERLAKNKTTIKRERQDLTKRKNELQEKLNALSGGNSGKGYRVVVPITSDGTGKLSLKIKYVIRNASWFPFYDARYIEKTGKVELTYYGNVTQSTGEDWTNAKLILSTAQPQLGSEPPSIYKWSVGRFMPPPPAPPAYASRKMAMAEEADMSSYQFDAVAAPTAMGAGMTQAALSNSRAVMQGENVGFAIDTRKDIPSDGQNHRVVIKEIEADAQKRFITVPRFDPRVYLSAKFKNPTEFLLLPGEISVFQNNDFIGKQYLSTSIGTDEEIDLAMGPVQAIKVEHKRVKDFTESTGIISKSKRDFYSYDIELSNYTKSAVEVEVFDHVPVSTNEDIIIEDAKFDPAPTTRDKKFEGEIFWKVSLDPAGKKKLRSQFSVKYPKDWTLEGL